MFLSNEHFPLKISTCVFTVWIPLADSSSTAVQVASSASIQFSERQPRHSRVPSGEVVIIVRSTQQNCRPYRKNLNR